ncbi:MAG: hypothetical protein ACRDE2_03390 [Chitinophagaceae bacterium]
MKKTILLFAMVISISITTASAQSNTSGNPDYKTGLGLRLGYPYGVTIKHFISQQGALEGILGFWYGGFNFTGLYEYHMDIKSAPGLKWFVGGGADFTSWNFAGYHGAAVGIDGIIGLDYKINSAPIDLSLDWKPSFYVSGVSGLYAGGGAISVRYTF